MTRCFVNPAQWNQPEISLSPEESHHLLSVLRAGRGKQITLFNGQGQVATGRLLGTKKGQVRVKILEDTRHNVPHPSVSITLIQAVPKHSLMDFIIQKATELGVSAIAPVLTERVIVRWTDREIQKRHTRWQRIALEAVKQCGLNWFPDIQPAVPLSDLLPQLSLFDQCIVASLHQKARPFREVINTMNRKTIKTIALVIGPEGDLAEHETKAMLSAGAVLARFGPNILRVETAALYGLSLLTYEFPANISAES